jgi:hypothetical protein
MYWTSQHKPNPALREKFLINSAQEAQALASRHPRVRQYARCIRVRSNGDARLVIDPDTRPYYGDVWRLDIHIRDQYQEWDLGRGFHAIDRRTGVLYRVNGSSQVPLSNEQKTTDVDDQYTWWKRLGCSF